MEPNSHPTPVNRRLLTLAGTTVLLLLAVLAAPAASLTFSTPANWTADTDVLAGGGNQLFAYSWGAGGTVNGVVFTPTTLNNGAVGPNLTLATFGGASATAFVGNATPFSGLSGSYSNILKGAVFNSTTGTQGTATLNNLIVGHKYLVEIWAGDPRSATTTTNRVIDVSSFGTAVRLYFNSTLALGGVGQYTYATFVADGVTQDILFDGSQAPTGWVGDPQFNAIQLRDISGVWSGTTSGTWADSDTTSQNFSGSSYATVKAATSDVYFGDKDANGSAVATSTITVGAGGASGVNANFNNNAVNYTLSSADATGIAGANGISVSGSGTVTLNGANSYSGNTTLNAGTLVLGTAGALGSTAAIVLNGGTLDATALASVSLASGQTLSGIGTVKGSVVANSGSVLIPGGVANAGTISINNNLALNGQAMTFDLGFGPGSGDKILVGNALTVNSTCTLSLNYLQGALAGGTYTLMTFASMSGAGTFVLDTTYPGVMLNVNPTSVTLTVGGGGGTSGTWTNLLGGTWGAATNWQGNIIATNTDAVADFSTLDITAARTVTINGVKTIGHLVFGDTVQNANWTLSTGTNVLSVSSGSPRIIVNGGQNTTISASLQGSQGFTKQGAGTLTLTGANRLTNAVNVIGGTLALGVNNPFGPTTGSSMVPVTLSNAILTVSGAYLLTNNITLPAGTSNYISAIPTSAGLYGSTGNPLSGAGTLVMNIVGANNPRLDGGDNQNFTGKLIVNSTGAGGLLSAIDDPPSLPRFGYAGSSNAVYVLNGSASSLFYMGTSDWVGGGRTGCTNYLGELDGTATIYANNGRSGTTTLEIGGLNTSSTFSGAINDNHLGATPYTPMIVRKVGSGMLTLAGASLYTGATDVRAGTLDVTGSLGNTPISVQSGATLQLDGSVSSATINIVSGGNLVLGAAGGLGSAAVTMNGAMDVTAAGSFNLGSATLSGAGTVTGALTLGSTSINPGPIGAAGTLTINGSFTATGGTLNFDLSSSPASGNDFLSVSGNMDFSTPGVTISINKLSGSLGSGGTYVLAQCGGTISGSVANLTLVGADPLDVLQISGNQLQLVVSAVTSLTWRGDGVANLWDIGTSTTWVNGATPSTYADGNAVTFDNTGGTNPVVNIPANVAPAIVSVTGATNYTFTGAGAISDGASLLKSGTGTLTIANTNLFTGGLFLNSGTVSVGSAGANGSLAGNINNNAALVFNTPLDQTASNSITGPGSFTKLGAAQLILTADSSITGPTIVSAGTLSVGDGVATAGALGTGVVTNNALLAINRPDSLTMSNAIRNLGGMVNLGGGTTILKGVLSGSGTLTNAAGAGTLELAASNTYSGLTYVSSGNVMLRNLAGFGTSSVFIDDASGSAINIAPVSGQTAVIPNNIRLPAATTPQFVVSDESLTAMATVRLTGLISGGLAANDTRLVNGGGSPAGNSRLTIVLENPANSFTTTPDVYSGCLAFNSDGALGDPSNGITVRASTTAPFPDTAALIGLRFNANNITLNANRTINLVGAENINVQTNNGTIAGPVTGSGLVKLGTGTLTLNGPCSLGGSTTVNAGTLVVNNTWTLSPITVASGATLGGSGVIGGPVTIANGGTLSPGASIGTLTITNTLSLSGTSTNTMEINASTLACDKVLGVTVLGYNGTLNVINTGGTLAAGQSFQLFGASSYSGNFTATNLPALDPSLRWSWVPTSGTLSVVPAVATNPTNITATVSGGNLSLSWPADHTGWRLQAQTNSTSVGLSGNWATVPGSTTVNTMSFPIDHANGTVFFRMVYP
jgi:autotransporter-associated beta strand protein